MHPIEISIGFIKRINQNRPDCEQKLVIYYNSPKYLTVRNKGLAIPLKMSRTADESQRRFLFTFKTLEQSISHDSQSKITCQELVKT